MSSSLRAYRVDRRLRRAKSDGIDAELLPVRTLLAWLRGEPRVCGRWSRSQTKPMRMLGGVSANGPSCSPIVSASTNRIGAVLATLGVNDYNPLLQSRRRRLAELRTGLDQPIPNRMHWTKLSVCSLGWSSYLRRLQSSSVNGMRLRRPMLQDRAGKMIQQLASLRGIGVQSATVLVREGALVRHFPNGKALGSYAGLTSELRIAAEESTASKASGRQVTDGTPER